VAVAAATGADDEPRNRERRPHVILDANTKKMQTTAVLANGDPGVTERRSQEARHDRQPDHLDDFIDLLVEPTPACGGEGMRSFWGPLLGAVFSRAREAAARQVPRRATCGRRRRRASVMPLILARVAWR